MTSALQVRFNNFIPYEQEGAHQEISEVGRNFRKEEHQSLPGLPAEVRLPKYRVWKILEEGTRIGYRNEEDKMIAANKTFHISEVETE